MAKEKHTDWDYPFKEQEKEKEKKKKKKKKKNLEVYVYRQSLAEELNWENIRFMTFCNNVIMLLLVKVLILTFLDLVGRRGKSSNVTIKHVTAS